MQFSVVSVLLLVFNIDWTQCLSRPNPCSVSKGCFTDGSCDSNGDGCDFVVTWVENTNAVTFTLNLAVTETADRWVALGLSMDTTMGADSVTDCIANGMNVDVTKSYNTDKSNAPLIGSAWRSGLSATSGRIADGVLTCIYTQTITDTHAEIYDLSTSWYLMVANGITTGGMKSKHAFNPIRSPSKVNLLKDNGSSGSSRIVLVETAVIVTAMAILYKYV